MIEFIWLLPLIGIPITGLISKKKGLVSSMFPLVSLFSLLALFNKLPLEASFLGLPLLIDQISLVFSLVVCFIGAIILVYSNEYMKEETGLNRYYFTILLFISSMMLLLHSQNLLGFYAGWEMVGFCSFFLIAFHYEKKAARNAGIKAFVVTRIGDIALLLGILMVYLETGGLSFSAVGEASTLFISMLFLLGAMAKSAQIPFHIWLPDAMEGPTPVSALLHSATMVKAGVYLIARFYPSFSQFPIWQYSVLIVGAISALLASLMAVFSYDIKEILAYSTISQIGYLFLAAGSGSLLAMSFHLINHALFKALLFLGAGCIIHLAGTRKMSEIGRISNKKVVIPFLIGSLALASIPPLGSYFSKEAIINSISNFPIPYFFSIITIPFTFIYALKVPLKIFSDEGEGEKISRNLTLPLIVLSILVVLSLAFKPILESYFGLVHHHPITAVYSLSGLILGGVLLYCLYHRVELKFSEKLQRITFFRFLTELIKSKFHLDISSRIIEIHLALSNPLAKLETAIEKFDTITVFYEKLSSLLGNLEPVYGKLSTLLVKMVKGVSEPLHKIIEIQFYEKLVLSLINNFRVLSDHFSKFETYVYSGLNVFLTEGNESLSKTFRWFEVEELDRGVAFLILGIIFILSLQLLLI